MAISTKGRSVMALYSTPRSAHSHRARFVLAEKGINVEIVDTDSESPSEDLIDLNPYQTVPTLVDRDLVLYDPAVITEYLDERYPHPPLMPVDPVSRARLRLALFRITADWYSLVDAIEGGQGARADQARKELEDQLIASDEVFAASKFFLHEELTLVDCALGPILWRLPYYGIRLPRQSKHVARYSEMLFERPSFTDSLSEAEREMR